MAQQLAHELRDEGLAVWNDLAHVHTSPHDAPARTSTPTASPTSLPMSMRVHRASNGQHIVDFRA
jgi:hypothetical protein